MVDSPPMDAGTADACIVPEPPAILEGCPITGSSADLGGHTPLGDVLLRHAWAGALEGGCYVGSLDLSPEPFLRGTWSFPSSRFPALRVERVPLGRTGRFEVLVIVDDGCARHEATGILTLTRNDYPGDDPRDHPRDRDAPCACDEEWKALVDRTCEGAPEASRVEGTLSVEVPGWSLEGSISTFYCHLLHGVCF